SLKTFVGSGTRSLSSSWFGPFHVPSAQKMMFFDIAAIPFPRELSRVARYAGPRVAVNTNRCYSRHGDPTRRSRAMKRIERYTAYARTCGVGRHACIAAVLVAVGLVLSGPADGQIPSEPGARIWAKLQQAQLLDPYYPDVVRQIAES